MPPPLTSSTVSAEHGFSLIEMLVAMLSVTVVMIALVAVLEFSTSQQSRINDRVQADRLGRIAMTRMIDELHSSCTGFGEDALQGPSATPTSPLAQTGAVNLWFISAYGSATSGHALPETVSEHDLNWEKTKSKEGVSLGTLRDYSFQSKANTGPKYAKAWEFPELKVANAKTTILSTNVIPPVVSGAETVFQYYTVSNETGAFSPLTASIPHEAIENNIVKVVISFTQAPEDESVKLARAVPYSDAVVLRLNPAETGTTVQDEPCS
jgi:Tfp pilus assembly protein PilW